MEGLGSYVLVAEIILFVALAALAIYLIFAIKKIVRSVETIEKNIDEIQRKANPVLENVSVITGEIKMQMGKVNDIVESVKNTTDSIVEFEQKAQKQIEGPVFESLNLVSSVYAGIKTFLHRLSDSTNNKPRRKSIESFPE
jgi:uncharacterized protein YoxC